MGLKFGFSTVLSFTRRVLNDQNSTDVKTDPGGGANLTATHIAPPGDDSHPLPEDLAALLPIAGEGNQAAAGYVDPKNAGLAEPGERRTYARNEDGEVVSSIWQKNDGSVLIESDGDIVVNGLTITAAGDIILPNGVSLTSHTHLYTDTGNPVNPQSTQPPTPA